MQEEAYAPRDMISMYSRVGDEALRGTSPRLKKYVWRPNRSTGLIPVARFNSNFLEMFLVKPRHHAPTALYRLETGAMRLGTVSWAGL